MKTFSKLAVAIWTAIIVPRLCMALDYQPFDWVPMSAGTNVLMGYYEFGERNKFNNTITGTYGNDTHLYSNIGIARYLYYSKVFDHFYDLDVVIPFGALTDGKVNGQRLGHASGVADPIVSLGYWIVNYQEAKRWISAASFLTLPIGSYDNHQALNLGGNRWQHDLQANITQGFLDKFAIDISGDWIWYGDNEEAGTGHQRLTQDSTFGAYAWLSYDVTPQVQRLMPKASRAFVSLGYAGVFGGQQKLDGVKTGLKTEEHQLRLTYQQFYGSNWQLLVSVSHDVSARGQFQQDFGLTVRVARLF